MNCSLSSYSLYGWHVGHRNDSVIESPSSQEKVEDINLKLKIAGLRSTERACMQTISHLKENRVQI